MPRPPFVLLATLLAGHALAQDPASPPTPSASQAAGEIAARLVDASPLGACFRRQPAYPPQALRNEQQARTLVVFTVTPAGAIQAAGLLRSSGHRLLDEAALGHLDKCIAASAPPSGDPLPPGRYALPMVWRIE